MADLPLYHMKDLEKQCPACKTPWFIKGQGSQNTAVGLTTGTLGEEGFDGAQSRYTCHSCGHRYIVQFEDGAVFIG